MMSKISQLNKRVAGCRKCPRLVAWREEVAVEKRAAFNGEDYWGKPVPGFGDPKARLVLVGLAPAAHGATAQEECSPGIDRGTGSTELYTVQASPINPNRSRETMDSD